MATNELAPPQRIEPTRALGNNARLCAPDHLKGQLHSLATTESLALIIDIDAFGRSPLARRDRLMTLALDALAHVGVQIAIVAKVELERAVALRRGIPRSWCLETDRAVSQIREQRPGLRMIAVSNDPELLATLGPDDRGIALAGEVAVRAVLWWLVSLRQQAGLAHRQ